MFQNDEKLEKGYHEIYEMMLDILYQKTRWTENTNKHLQ